MESPLLSLDMVKSRNKGRILCANHPTPRIDLGAAGIPAIPQKAQKPPLLPQRGNGPFAVEKNNIMVLRPQKPNPSHNGAFAVEKPTTWFYVLKTKNRAQQGPSGPKTQRQGFYTLKTKPRAQRDHSGQKNNNKVLRP